MNEQNSYQEGFNTSTLRFRMLTSGPELVTSEVAYGFLNLIRDYRIAPQKNIVLILECSGTKPWTFSYVRRILSGLMRGTNWEEQVEILTLSSMLGIVPSPYEQDFPAAYYDWNIDAESQSERLNSAVLINSLRVHDFLSRQPFINSKTCIAATHGRFRVILGDASRFFKKFKDLGWSEQHEHRSLDIIRLYYHLTEELSCVTGGESKP
jgi:predicted RNA-binding protein